MQQIIVHKQPADLHCTLSSLSQCFRCHSLFVEFVGVVVISIKIVSRFEQVVKTLT
jgi:hypothetical protein